MPPLPLQGEGDHLDECPALLMLLLLLVLDLLPTKFRSYSSELYLGLGLGDLIGLVEP
jgi:hypothetical protein